MSEIAKELTTLFSDLIKQKPTTKTDAVAMLRLIELRLASWIVSDLPTGEQKIVLASRGFVKEKSCWKYF